MRKSLEKVWRILVAAAYGFWRDDCYTKSSVLTLYTLQSLVPFLAFLLGIAQGFGFDTYVRDLIINIFEKQKEAIDYAIRISYSMLAHLKGGVIAGIGVIFLFWTVVTLLGYIEFVLNDIWKVKTPRNFLRKFSDYLAIILICPLIIVVSSSLTVYIKTQILQLESYPGFETIGNFILLLFKLSPFILSWLLFLSLYFLIPNTKLVIWPRLIAAIFAGSLFQLWQLVYINAQIYLFSYNVVYGTVAVLPLFLIWLQVSWLIALAGAELSSHMENDYFFDPQSLVNVEKINKNQLGLLVLFDVLEAFYSYTPPPTSIQIANHLKIPLDATQKMLDILTNGGILAELSLKNGETGYHPLSNPDSYTVKKICDVINQIHDDEILTESSDPLNKVTVMLNKIDHAIEHSDGNITLKDFFLKK